ncbi:alpha-(1,3)-fucosyltransferase fut-5-like [Mercenaria mercenaria]|uniref:alpha-(1,3)-fucosyltransferase fut-5-like n=1 Tax=Mercenaria mercenaria TaxID=6596 RepID=UPI001E1DA82D|nr:alpha-(1,3)-fucosyltransferase fut-5-like [Mercenaria mercenaria]
MRFHSRAFLVYSFILLICMHLMIKKQDKGNNDHTTRTLLVQSINFSKVTINISHNLLYFTSNIFDISAKESKTTIDRKIIVFFNVPEYMQVNARKDTLYRDCEYKNCIISFDINKMLIADAVIFYVGIRNKRMGKDPPIDLKQRNPNQAWIFTSVEPPEHFYNTDYQSASWHNTMNWSSLYRLDSDIPNPYGCLIRSMTINKQDYVSIYNAKTRNALWMVSHCQVSSARRLYVTELIRSGFDVDIIGECSSDGRKLSPDEFEQIVHSYKYYLAFENSFCEDYISEKFFQHFNLSWIIVVRGGANYKRLLPKNTYINTADFSNISILADYLLTLGNDKERYVEFLRNKDKYVSIRWHANRNCEICRRLNNLSKYRKTYTSLGEYLTGGQCFRPKDL